MEFNQNKQDSHIGNNINQKVNPSEIATNFVNFYYSSLDININNLIDANGKFIYKNNSEYCIQGLVFKGPNDIFNKIRELNQRGCIQLDGFLYTFTEYFHLASGKDNGEWWIQSDILRTL